MRAVDRLIAQCPAERDELLADYGAQADQIALIPSAVDTDRFRPVAKSAARHKLEIDPTAEMIVYVGRIVPCKDVRNIVQALARLKRDDSLLAPPRCRRCSSEEKRSGPTKWPHRRSACCVPWRQSLACWTGCGSRAAGSRTSCTSGTPPLMWPSRHLGTSRSDSPLEAMACGTPVIGSQVGGIAFTVADGETGLVPPRDPEALCARLEEMLRDPARRTRMGRAGRARCSARFHVAAGRDAHGHAL